MSRSEHRNERGTGAVQHRNLGPEVKAPGVKYLQDGLFLIKPGKRWSFSPMTFHTTFQAPAPIKIPPAKVSLLIPIANLLLVIAIG